MVGLQLNTKAEVAVTSVSCLITLILCQLWSPQLEALNLRPAAISLNSVAAAAICITWTTYLGRRRSTGQAPGEIIAQCFGWQCRYLVPRSCKLATPRMSHAWCLATCMPGGLHGGHMASDAGGPHHHAMGSWAMMHHGC